MANKVIFITTTGTTSFVIPADWNNASNTIEVLGSGGAGAGGTTVRGGGAGGSGQYRIANNLSYSAGANISVIVDPGGNGGGTVWDNGGVGTLIQSNPGGGGAGASGGAGGSGGSGGTPTNGAAGGASGTALSGGGGAGAPGPNGAASIGATPTAAQGGGGGGGANGGTAGNVGSAATGGTGGNNRLGSGGGTSGGGAGSNGGGGGGGNTVSSQTGGNGSTDAIWTQTSDSATAGPGSGGGGAGGVGATGAATGGNGGTYGGGGGGGDTDNSGSSSGGNGGQGLIVITYLPLVAALTWLPTTQDKNLSLKQRGGSLLAGVITPQPAAVFNYRSVYSDAPIIFNNKYYISGWFTESTTGETATKFPQWLSTYSDIVPVNTASQNKGFYSLTPLPAVTNFPQWQPKYDDKVPPKLLQQNSGSVTFNPRSIVSATFQTLTIYPDKLLAVPTVFPSGTIATTTPQNVVISSLSWLPTFNAKIPLSIFQLTIGWFTNGTGAGSTIFPAWFGQRVDLLPKLPFSHNTGSIVESTTGETATKFPEWLSLYTDKIQSKPISVNAGSFVNNNLSSVVINTYPQWTPNYPSVTRQNLAKQAEFISNIWYGPQPTVTTLLSLGGPFPAKKRKNNNKGYFDYDRPILAEHAEILEKKAEKQIDDDDFFMLF